MPHRHETARFREEQEQHPVQNGERLLEGRAIGGAAGSLSRRVTIGIAAAMKVPLP